MSGRGLLEGKCAQPQDTRPMITTCFCVYEEGHGGNHSWEDTAAKRAERLFAADRAVGAADLSIDTPDQPAPWTHQRPGSDRGDNE